MKVDAKARELLRTRAWRKDRIKYIMIVKNHRWNPMLLSLRLMCYVHTLHESKERIILQNTVLKPLIKPPTSVTILVLREIKFV